MLPPQVFCNSQVYICVGAFEQCVAHNHGFYMKLSLNNVLRFISQRPLFFKLFPPYEYVQNLAQTEVHKYVGVDRSEIKNWVIVGGYLGKEVPLILGSYGSCQVTIFECSRRYITDLKSVYKYNQRVRIVEKAVSNSQGSIKFYETNLNGSGSLLRVGSLAVESYGMQSREEYTVEATTLDAELPELRVDVLQIDVQGAEKLVLEGAPKILTHVRAVFIETSWHSDFYVGSSIYLEIQKFLCDLGFAPALLGCDFNLTGNALFVRQEQAV